jgi:hypothetical protein
LADPTQGDFKQHTQQGTSMQLKQAKAMFTVAALFNFTAAILLHPASGIAAALGLTPLMGGGPFDQIALLAIAVFGIVYWIVAADPSGNHGLIKIGLISKLGVVGIIVWHYVAGTANLRMLVLVFGDVLFALAFVAFLVTPARR